MSHGPKSNSGIVLYQTEDGRTRLEVQFMGESAWLTQAQMAELFQTTKQNVSLHIRNIFDEKELDRKATVKESLTVQLEGKRSVQRPLEFYNLDVIISVGYRVKSRRGTQFRVWATQRLREFIIKGFALDDERLKRGGGGSYFEEPQADAHAGLDCEAGRFPAPGWTRDSHAHRQNFARGRGEEGGAGVREVSPAAIERTLTGGEGL
jgi:hypothetical protein